MVIKQTGVSRYDACLRGVEASPNNNPTLKEANHD